MSNPQQYEEFHPCFHRWEKIHPEEPSSKPMRYVSRPFTENMDLLAKPLCRRLLNLFLTHSGKMEDGRRSKLVSRLVDCGFTEEQLDDLLREEKRKSEIRQRLADAGPFDVFDEDGNLLTPFPKKNKIKIKKKKPKKKEEAGDHDVKKKDENSESNDQKEKEEKKGKAAKGKQKQKGLKKAKSGQLKTGWPHSIAVQLMLQTWSFADSAPDEDYIGRAPSYFDVQASALLDVISAALGIRIAKDEIPNSYERRIIQGCLNLAVWIGKHVTTPAQLIEEKDIEKLLSLRGDVEEKEEENESENEDGETEMYKLYGRQWTLSPIAIPRRRADDEKEVVDMENGSESHQSTEGGYEINQYLFQQLAKCYTPTEPEFMYQGPRNMPKQVKFTEEGERCEFWHLENVEGMEPQRMVPCVVQQYFPRIRQLETRAEDFWYIMSDPSLYQQEQLKWATAENVEIIQMVFNLVSTMVNTPEMPMERVLQGIEEICQAILETQQDEEITEDEGEVIDGKRTIVLERLFVEIFSPSLRDFNESTKDYMRIICRKGAVLIRHLYEHTAVELWKMQMTGKDTVDTKQPESPSSEAEPDDASEKNSLDSDWEEWEECIKDHLKVTRFIKEWKAWLNDSIPILEKPECREQLLEEAKKWQFKSKEIIFLEEKIHDIELEKRRDRTGTGNDESWSEVE